MELLAYISPIFGPVDLLAMVAEAPDHHGGGPGLVEDGKNDLIQGLDSGKDEKDYLKAKMEFLRSKIVEEKNKKGRTSIRNGKLMNAVEQSIFNTNNHMEHSRRSNIKIKELKD